MTVERIGIIAAAVLVAAGLAGGFALIGSPSHQREVAFDERRVEDLGAIVDAVQTRYHSDDARRLPLPAALPADLTSRYGVAIARTDPVTHLPYEYRRLSAARLRLCATFATTHDPDPAYPGWSHPAGRHCYTFDLAQSSTPSPDQAGTEGGR